MANEKSEAAKAKNADKKGGGASEDNSSAPGNSGNSGNSASTEDASSEKGGQNLSIRVAGTNSAAKDDHFDADNTDWLAEAGDLAGTLNVLANDPGSAHIVAIHGEAPSGPGMIEPTTEATATIEHNGAEYEILLSINEDGTVEVDASSLSGNLDLAEGETLEATFYYTAQMGKNGVMSTAAVTIEITGSDTPAEISGEDTGTVQEDGTLEASGALVIDDPDAGEAEFEAPADADLVGVFGDFTFDPLTGDWTYALRNEDVNVQALNTGDSETDTLTVMSLDGTSHDIVVTVEGADEEDPDAGEPTQPENGGFEDGLTGFLTLGSVGAVGSTVTTDNTVDPNEGTQMAGLSTEGDFGDSAATAEEIETFLGLTLGTLTGLGNGTAVEGSAVSTSLVLNAGQTLSFDYFFDTDEPATTNDFAFLTLTGEGTSEVTDVEAVGDFSDSGWTTYNFTATADGTYDLGIGVVDVTDSAGLSLLFLDNFIVF